MAKIEEEQKTPTAASLDNALDPRVVLDDLDPRVLDAIGQRELIGRLVRKFHIENFGAILAEKLQDSIIHYEHATDADSRLLVKFNNDPNAVHPRGDTEILVDYLINGEYAAFQDGLAHYQA